MSQNKQDKGFRFSIRKRSVGVCGVAIATFLLGSGLIFQSNVVKATEPSVAAVAGENIAAHNLQVKVQLLMEEMLLEQLTVIVITHGVTAPLPIQIFKIILGGKLT